MNTIKAQMGISEWLDLLGLAFLWGVSFFVIAIAVTELAPLTIVALRVTIAALVIWTAVIITGHRLPTKISIWFSFAIMGLLNNIIPFSLIVWGQQTISGGLASILNATTPMFTVLVAGILLSDEKLNARKIAGTITGFCGVAIMMGPESLRGLTSDTLAKLAVMGAALSYAFAGVWGRRFRQLDISTTVVACGQLSMSTLVMIPAAIFATSYLAQDPSQTFTGLTDVSATTWAAVLVLAVFCTAFAYLLYFRILSSSGAVNLSFVTLLIPVTAVLLGVVFLGESFGWTHFFGMLLIALGLGIVDGRLWSYLQMRFTPASL